MEDNEFDGRFFAVISYVGFFSIVVLLLKKDDQFIRTHAKQGLILFILEVFCWFFWGIPLLGFLAGVGYFVLLVAALWGIFFAVRGKPAVIPLLTDLAHKLTI